MAGGLWCVYINTEPIEFHFIGTQFWIFISIEVSGYTNCFEPARVKGDPVSLYLQNPKVCKQF